MAAGARRLVGLLLAGLLPAARAAERCGTRESPVAVADPRRKFSTQRGKQRCRGWPAAARNRRQRKCHHKITQSSSTPVEEMTQRRGVIHINITTSGMTQRSGVILLNITTSTLVEE